MPIESGFAVTIKGFIPVDKSDLAAHRDALDAVIAATEARDFAALLKVMRIEAVKADPVNRRERNDG